MIWCSIMGHLHKYVPVVNFSKDFCIEDKWITVPRAVMYPVLFGGDQLTATWGRGAQKIRMNSLSPSMWFDGLIPCAEDWHTKVILLKVIIIINGIRIHPYILKYIKHIQTCLRTSIYIYTPLSCRWFGSTCTTTTENQHRSMVLCINNTISSTSPMLVLCLKKLQLLWGFLSVDCSWPPCHCINGYPEHGVKTRSTNFGSCFRLNRKVDWTKREQETGIVNCVQESCWQICLISVPQQACTWKRSGVMFMLHRLLALDVSI